jgi:GT2 family glycosyltransferase
MGVVRFSIDPRLVRELTQALPLKVFVETGTYEGDSVAAARPYFDELHTVEIADDLYERAAERFAGDDSVHVHHGDSAEILGELRPKLQRKAVLYWLDAHWCGSELERNEGGSPLLAELAAIGKLSKRDVVLIDDARLFMAPPPPPANPEQWPTLDQVLGALGASSSSHELIVIDDVLTFAPKEVSESLRQFARAGAVDLLAELKSSQQVAEQLERIGTVIEKRQAASDRREEGEQGRLGKVVRTLKSVQEELGEQRSDYAARLERFNGALTALQRQLGEQRGEDQVVLGEVRGAITALQTHSRDRDLAGPIGEVLSGFEAMRGELEDQRRLSNGRIGELNAGLGSIRTGVEELKGEALENLTGSVEALRAELQEQKGMGNGRVEELSEGLGAIRSRVDQLKSETLAELATGVEGLRAQLQEQNGTGNGHVEELSQGLGAIRSGVEEVKDETQRSSEALERSLRNELEPLKLRLEVMREQTEVASSRLGEIESLDGQLQLMREHTEDVDTRLDGMSTQLEQLQRQLALLVAPTRNKLIRRRKWKRRLRPLLWPLLLIAAPFRALNRTFFFKRQALRLRVYLSRLRLRPKLGRLEHHPPIDVQVPKRYLKPVKLSDPPTISIVTPSYNQGEYVEQTITSILDQEYPKLEYVIQDGNSTDETRSVLERYGPRLHRWEMREDDGHAHAVNLGFAGSSGEIMAWLNSDDILLPGALAYVARYFERHPKVDAVYGHRVLIDDAGKEIGRWVMPRHSDKILSWADYVPQETLFWRRSLWEKIGGELDGSWPFALDWDLLVRFVDADAKIVRVPRFLGGFRIHPAQKTSSIAQTQGKDEMNRIRLRTLGREPSRQEIGDALRWYLRRHVVLHKLYRARLLRY